MHHAELKKFLDALLDKPVTRDQLQQLTERLDEHLIALHRGEWPIGEPRAAGNKHITKEQFLRLEDLLQPVMPTTTKQHVPGGVSGEQPKAYQSLHEALMLKKGRNAQDQLLEQPSSWEEMKEAVR